MLALDSDTDQGLCAGNVCSVVDVSSRLPGMLGSGYALVYGLPRLSVHPRQELGFAARGSKLGEFASWT